MQQFEETTSFTVEFVIDANIFCQSLEINNQLQWLIPSSSKEKFINGIDWETYWEP